MGEVDSCCALSALLLLLVVKFLFWIFGLIFISRSIISASAAYIGETRQSCTRHTAFENDDLD